MIRSKASPNPAYRAPQQRRYFPIANTSTMNDSDRPLIPSSRLPDRSPLNLSPTMAPTRAPGGTPPELDQTTPAGVPRVDQSYMRWSQTASSVFSDRSNFYFAKRSTSAFSDLGALDQSRPVYHRDEAVDPLFDGGSRRGSVGTFGRRGQPWTTDSSPVNRPSPGGSRSPSETASPPDTGVPPSRRPSASASRPMSMSSATDSTTSGALPPPNMLRAYSTPGIFPSPNFRRPSHESSETDQAIHALLLRKSAQSDNRIVPRPKPTVTVTHPTEPDRGRGDDSRRFDEDWPISRSQKTSKIDQVLGAGAVRAQAAIMFERSAFQSVVEPRPKASAIPPPPRGGKTSASVAIPRARKASGMRNHLRSASVDSLPACFQPSFSDSVTSLAALSQPLLPPMPLDKALPDQPETSGRHHVTRKMRSDLTAEERQVLLRRARKLERVLGESLCEDNISRLVIDPAYHSRHTRAGSAPLVKSASFGDGLSGQQAHAVHRNAMTPETHPGMAQATRAHHCDELTSERKEPKSPTETVVSEGQEHIDDEEDARRLRRQQVAKLHRMFGVPVPASLVGFGSSVDLAQTTPYRSRATSSSATEQSFLSFDSGSHGATWGSKIRNASISVRDKFGNLKIHHPGMSLSGSSTPRHRAREDSFFDLAGGMGGHSDLGRERNNAPRKRST